MNTTNFTDRDLKLLRMLGFVVIIGIFAIIDLYAIVRPMQKKNEEIAKAQETHDIIEMKIDNLDAVQQYVADMQTKVDAYSERYYPMMDSTEIDQMLTGMARKRGLRAADLLIDIPSITALVVPYPYSDAVTQPEEESVEPKEEERAVTDAANWTIVGGYEDAEDKEEEAEPEEIDSTYAGVYAANVSFKSYGEKNDLQALLDEITQDRSMRVTNYSWDYSTINSFSYVGTELVQNDVGKCSLTINMEVYMFDADAYIEQAQTDEETEEE
ncbi:MAG: hypothetical protein K6G07_06085 [Lachnospiraceae bacterium]|nr:hypothetical protein [Lachnospiraceae bacterium]